MARLFDPLVFQPNVFQVGTLDVVIPDVATKRRKWLSLSVPGSGRVGGATAFAVSRDSAGILISVRDKAAPQFAVSRDADGLLLSARPVATVVRTLYASAMMYTTDPGHDIYAPAVVFYDADGALLYGTVSDYFPANYYAGGFCLGYLLSGVPAGAVTFKVALGGSFDAETQFFVSKVRIGMSDADPVNLCPNPNFAANVSDGWTYPDAPGDLSYEATRVTSAPVALPAGESACARMRWRLNGGANPMQSVALASPAGS